MCRATRGPRYPLLCIVPTYMLAQLARQTEPRLRRVAEAALRTLVVSERIRGERTAVGGIAPLVVTPAGAKRRTVYDAQGGSELPGVIVRGEGDAPAADAAADEAYDGLGATYDLLLAAFKRNSIDGRGMRLDATVHYRNRFNNAFWNGRQMVFGDGDGVIFQRFTKALDVIGHELGHGVTQYEANLDYADQPGALNEHFSDVLGSLVKQFTLKQTADQADWLIGAGLFAPSVKGRALRSMSEPGTAYDDPRIGKDPQPAHMRDYVETEDDSGGVHINSGIPNRAFYLAATGLGGNAWLNAGRIWYLALTERLRPRSNFQDAAAATIAIASAELDACAADVVKGAWQQVGVAIKAPRPKRGKARGPAGRGTAARPAAARRARKERSDAHPRRAKRRRGGASKRARR